MSPSPEFWHERWREGVTPWHQSAPNRFLSGHFPALGLAEGSVVLVPLCGKTVDMRTLLQWRYRVLGVELSGIAARAFFDENGLRYERHRDGAFTAYAGSAITILCGDVFDLECRHLAEVDVVYDRAALIALDAPTRARYARHLVAALPAGVGQLLVTLEYDQARMEGPPYCVSAAEVNELYGDRYGVRSVGSVQILDEEPRFRERGLDTLTEHGFLLVDSRA